MSKKINLKAEKAKRNQEYALRFKKKKRSRSAGRPASAESFGTPSVGGGGGGGSSRSHVVTCAACNVETTVPFKPTNGKPVYCRDCFQKVA